MEFYPNNIPATQIGFAISASRAATGSLIRNFAAVPVTASIALNIVGTPGTNGTNAGPIIGPKGAQGTRGVTGPRGNSVYLLSSSWYSGPSCGAPPANCYAFVFYPTYTVGGIRYCDFSDFSSTYYSTDSTLTVASSPMFYNDTCTSPMITQRLGVPQDESTTYQTDGSGILQTLGICEQTL